MPESEDYDKTWLERTAQGASAFAAEDDAEEGNNALQVGTRIDEFEITGLIGIGGFGIVYEAKDHSLGRTVALKEYMPSSLAARKQGLTVAVKSPRLAETFALGRRSFVNESKMLASFDHPALVKVYRFWEANGTAYMVMPYYKGNTLKQALQRLSGPPSEAWLRSVIEPLLDALDVIHSKHCYHRDIAPDNILLLADGRPVLLDFGAAREVIGDRTQLLTVILKPGYAPLEQYAEDPHVKQGAWTDIYALSAVVYNAITGRPPLASVARSIKDTLVPLAVAARGRYSDSLLCAIDMGLAVQPQDRPQTVAAFRALLNAEPPDIRPESNGRQEVKDAKKASSSERGAPGSVANASANAPANAAANAAPAGAKRMPLYVGAVGALLLLGAGAIYMLKSQTDAPLAAKATAPIAAPLPTAAPAAASVQVASAGGDSSAARIQTADKKDVTEQQLVELLLGKDGGSAQSGVVKPFDPVDMLHEIYRQRDAERVVTVVPEQAKVSIGRDKLRFRVSSSKPGYLYVLMVDSDRKHFNLLFPNAIDAENGIAGDGELSLPRPGWAMTAGGPAGTDYFIAIVSENRRDFTAAGLQKVDPFAEFPLKSAEKIARQTPAGAKNPFAGKPVCSAGRDCSARYGAAVFAIEEVD